MVKILDKFNSQNSISSIDFDKKKSKLKDYEVSAFPEENEEEYSEENDNDINLYTNIDKLMNNCPSLNEGEFILIEKETKPIIEEYEKYYIITQGSGDIIETQTKILRSNEESYDLPKEKKGDRQLNTSNILKEIYYEYDKDNKDEEYIKDFIKKKWKYFVKLFIIEKNRKADEYRKFILQALMKYQFKKNFDKKLIKKENTEINNNTNKITKINIIKNEPIINIINEDEIMDEINFNRKQGKIGINKEEIEIKPLTKYQKISEPKKHINSKIKNKLIKFYKNHEKNNKEEKKKMTKEKLKRKKKMKIGKKLSQEKLDI